MIRTFKTKPYVYEVKDVNKTIIRKTIMELINSDCDRKYPTYCQRINHCGVKKTYRGFYTKLDSGFIICHKNSNLFKLYDDTILTPNIEEILDRSKPDSKFEDQMIGLFNTKNDGYKEPVIFANLDDKFITAWTPKQTIVVPSKYYIIAHKLLGNQTEKYIDEKANGIFFESPKGKALVMKIK